MVDVGNLVIRRATADDVGIVLDLFDRAVSRLVAAGRSGQWGSTPASQRPDRVEQVQTWCGHTESWVAELHGTAVGVLVLGDHPPHVPAVDEPELYVELLLGSPGHPGVGAYLLGFADSRADAHGVNVLRVDCYRGDDGHLVAFYEKHGFRPVSQFRVGTWPGQVFERRLS